MTRKLPQTARRTRIGRIRLHNLSNTATGITFDQIGDFSDVADGSNNAVAAVEEEADSPST